MATRMTGERHTPTGTADALARLRRRLTGERRRATTVALAPHGRQVGPALAGGTRPGRGTGATATGGPPTTSSPTPAATGRARPSRA